MKSAGRSTPSASSVIGSVEVLEQSSASAWLTYGAISANTLCLSDGSSKTASITRSQPVRSAGSAVGGDPAEQLGLLLLGALAPADRLVEQALGVGLALLGVGLLDVLEHDLHAGPGARVGDAGAHHPGAEDADLGALPGLDALRAQRAGVDRLQVEEERLDHVLRALVDDQVRQVARLDPRGGVEVGARTLDRSAQDRARGGVDGALGLLAQQRRERRQERRQRRRLRGATGHLVARARPTGSGGDSGLALIHAFAAGTSSSRVATSSSTRPFSLACAGLNWVPWSSTSISAGCRPSIRTVRVTPPPPGSRPSEASGRPIDDRVVVDDHPVVAGQADLVATAQRGAVDRGDDRARELLEAAQAGLDPLGQLEDLRRRRPWSPGP